MVQVKARSLVDTHLNTGIKEYHLSKGQVFICDLKRQEVLDDLVKLGVLEIVDPTAPEVKPIPVFYPLPVSQVLFDDHGQPLPLSGGLDDELEQDVQDGHPLNPE